MRFFHRTLSTIKLELIPHLKCLGPDFSVSDFRLLKNLHMHNEDSFGDAKLSLKLSLISVSYISYTQPEDHFTRCFFFSFLTAPYVYCDLVPKSRDGIHTGGYVMLLRTFWVWGFQILGCSS